MDQLVWYFAVLAPFVYLGPRRATQKSSNLPPGPPRDPIIGHVLKLPKVEPWKKFAEWGKRYGPVIFAEALGRRMIVVNTITAAHDLMEKKSTNFSDRPKLTLVEVVGWDAILLVLQYHDRRFREQRRLTRLLLGASAIHSYESIMEERVQKLLHQLLVTPDDFYHHLHGLISSIVVKIVYGYDTCDNPLEDPLVQLNEQGLNLFKSTGNLGATILDFFPSLRYLPSWLPGMGAKRIALEAQKVFQVAFSQPFEDVKLKKAAGNAPPCLVDELLNDHGGSQQVAFADEEARKGFAGAFYFGATETTTATLQAFFLMMVLHPDVQKRAQEDIERNIEQGRLPQLSDKDRLPYVECILKEVLRVHPPFPLGVPHRTNQADTYSSWTIPEKTTVLPNIWAMMKDEELFPDPERFDPDRHTVQSELKQSGGVAIEDPVASVFGFGRRLCPGRAFAEAVIWLTMAQVLAAFDILPYKDPETGKDILPSVEYESEIVNSVKPFKCSIVPRPSFVKMNREI